jgi:FkbM family methyltransferase
MGFSKTIFTMQQVGFVSYMRNKLLKRGTRMQVRIAGRTISIRARTRDLSVAIDSLCKEYEDLVGLLPEGFKGLIIDAGGYIGTAAIRLAELYPDATVVSVEPSSENLGILRANIAGQPRIHAVHAALTSKNGVMVTLRDPRLNEWGFTLVDVAGSDATDLEDVPSVSVSGLSTAFGKEVGFLKMDIEGAEVDVLGDELLRKTAPTVLFVELHERTVPGCVQSFMDFGRDRANYRGEGEKYLSVVSGAKVPEGFTPLN